MVEKIPKGKVATYGQIASFCGLPGQARFVGYALHNTPFGVEIPWHRVVNAQGRISFPKESVSYKRQKELLKKEGILIIKEKIDLELYRWIRMK
ncbi:MAG: methylated-DNA--[protein]-cysteine S-methyltransferase [Ignavibacteriae bacterium]|nr:methylated-DNA--[protein]-cysteine S-methyltransferase [Ignavibacteriota bacterium]